MLALYHPDPNIRLAASWDYAEIEALINSGSGGGEKQLAVKQLTVSNSIESKLNELNEIKKLNKLIIDDPLMRSMKKMYDKESKERKSKIEKEIGKASFEEKGDPKESTVENLRKTRESEKQKEDRAKRNIFESRSLSSEEKEKRRIEDISLSSGADRIKIELNNINNIPNEYTLEQNYPNPFNPITTISYSIPKSGLIKIKVYDITGKEIQTLVEEFKDVGRYEVSFEGSNLASGVYFYKLEARNFVQTKRMVLIK